MEKAFKSTLFGGFDKKDVFNFIESSVREKELEIKAIEKEKNSIKAQLNDKNAKIEALEKQLAESRKKVDELEKSAEKYSGDLAQIEEKRLEVDQLFAKYNDQRDSIASIELDAHRRAIESKNQVDDYILKAATEFNKTLDQARDSYISMKNETQTLLSLLLEKLTDSETRINDVCQLFDGTAQTFDNYKLDVTAIADEPKD